MTQHKSEAGKMLKGLLRDIKTIREQRPLLKLKFDYTSHNESDTLVLYIANKSYFMIYGYGHVDAERKKFVRKFVLKLNKEDYSNKVKVVVRYAKRDRDLVDRYILHVRWLIRNLLLAELVYLKPLTAKDLSS